MSQTPTPIDKSEGVKKGAFAVIDPPPLPVDEKFLFWLDDEGDYLIQCQRENEFLTAHAATPEDAVWRMREVLAMAKALKADYESRVKAKKEAIDAK